MAPVYIGIRGYKELGREGSEEERVVLELEEEKCRCRHCGSSEVISKGRYERQARHLETYGKPSRLIIRLRRWGCRSCGKSYVPELPGIRPWRRSTEPWRASIYREHHDGVCASTMARVHKLGEATVERIYAEHTRRKAKERMSQECPQVLGLDEHRVHRNQPFATTFCDLKNRRIFDIVPGRSEREVRQYLSGLRGREKVKVVCIDLSSPYRALVRKWFPKARIVADRFHVVRLVHQHFGELTRQIAPELKGRKSSLFRARKEKLTVTQQKLLEKHYEHHPVLRILHEKLRELWELLRIKKQKRKECRSLITHLLKLIEELKESGLEPLIRLSRTLQNWKEEIATMWRFTRNNGITEGFHRKMKLIQRRAYGFKNFDNYRLRVIAQCG